MTVHRTSSLLSAMALTSAITFSGAAVAGGGPIVHDIDFEFLEFEASGTAFLPLGPNMQPVQTEVIFDLNIDQISGGNTLIAEDGDLDLILEDGENSFVESVFDIYLDISFRDIDPTRDFNVASGLLTYQELQFSMSFTPFVPQCPTTGGVAFGGCGMLLAVNSSGRDYDGVNSADDVELGFDVTGDNIHDLIVTDDLAFSFFGATDTTIIGGEVVQQYDVSIEWGGSINPDFVAVLDGTAEVSTFTDPGPIPVPAAVWLFASGLLGLVGVARRSS